MSHDNNLIIISLTSWTLGMIVGISMVYRSRLSYYFITVSVFHLCEFIANALYGTVTHHLFLIWYNKGSKEYWMVQLISVIEYYFCRRSSWLMGNFGLVLLLLGIGMRFMAIRTLGTSFSHYIKTTKVPLVTTGIYAVVRHPSYLGFYIYVLGLQLYLRNYFTALGSAIVLSYFFRRRIQFEEYFLIKHHPHYGAYKSNTRVYIPFSS